MLETLRALAEPSHFQIVELLLKGPRPVGDVVDHLGISQPQASKHLGILSDAGLVGVREDAQRRIYALRPEPLERNSTCGSTVTPGSGSTISVGSILCSSNCSPLLPRIHERNSRVTSSSTPPTRRIGRSLLAGLAGIFTAVVPTLATDALLHAAGLFSDSVHTNGNATFFIATIYRTMYGLAGSYVVARVAPYCPMAHALVLGAIGTLVNILAVVVTWHKGPSSAPTGIRSRWPC
jgi:DNA-binding transcriptional ArsR family regulator